MNLLLYRKRLLIPMVVILIALFILPVFVSMFCVDEAVGSSIWKAIKSHGCDNLYTRKDVNVFNPLSFYMNMDYWLADYRLSDSYLLDSDKKNCLIVAIGELARAKSGARIVFVNQRGVVTAEFTSR